MPINTKPVGVNTVESRQSINRRDGASFDDYDVPEGDRVPSLTGHGQALEQECLKSSEMLAMRLPVFCQWP